MMKEWLVFTLLSTAFCVVIPTSNPNWYFSEHNWYKTSSYAQTANPGSYFKVEITRNSFKIGYVHRNNVYIYTIRPILSTFPTVPKIELQYRL
jgi:hypothetical protein